MMKTKGQKNLFSRAYIQTDHLIGKLGGPTSNYYHLKETRLNAWSDSTSPPPTMKQNIKH